MAARPNSTDLQLTPAERDQLERDLRASFELAARVEAEAYRLRSQPGWLWALAAAIFVAAVAASAVWPWGVAP